MGEFEIIAREVNTYRARFEEVERRLAEVERVNARLESAALTTARALDEISRRWDTVSRHWDAVYDVMRREEKQAADVTRELERELISRGEGEE